MPSRKGSALAGFATSAAHISTPDAAIKRHHRSFRTSWRPSLANDPAGSPCLRAKKPEWQFRGRVQRSPKDELARDICEQRRERGDFDGGRNERPVEPGASNGGELDVAKPKPMTVAQPPVNFPQSEKRKSQHKSL